MRTERTISFLIIQKLFVLTVPRPFVYCSFSLYVGFCKSVIVSCHCLFLIVSSVGTLGRLYFVIVAFSGYIYMFVADPIRRNNPGKERPAEVSNGILHYFACSFGRLFGACLDRSCFSSRGLIVFTFVWFRYVTVIN